MSISFNFAAPLEFARREMPTETHHYRTDFMRDRDRIMYCSAFRRLAGKTQIYLTGTNDHQRNRLTHTLEVSQIARTISNALHLDCDLTEAIALGHDLGHTPFGHAGETTLHEIMVPNSRIAIEQSPMNNVALSVSQEIKMPLFGFKHNVQSLRIAASLEKSYGKYGLNLTNYSLWGILHHSSTEYAHGRVDTEILVPDYVRQYDNALLQESGSGQQAWSFEAFVVAMSDEIAQWHHDLEDALRGKAMSWNDVCNTIKRSLRKIMTIDDLSILDELKTKRVVTAKYLADLSRIVVNSLVSQIIDCSTYNLEYLWKHYALNDERRLDFFRSHDHQKQEIAEAIAFKRIDEKKGAFLPYQRVISEKIHHSREVERMNAKGMYIIRKLFQAYFSHPQQLPDGIINQYMVDVKQYFSIDKALQVGSGAVRKKFEGFVSNTKTYTIGAQIMLMRKICDHIAGMTDHYAIEEYENLYG